MNPVSLIIMIILISLLVLVHEWGHYIAARIFKVKVTKFGIGMPIGPTLFKTKKGDLEILVHACLLGGYVSFPDDEEDKDGNEVLPKDSPERLMNQPAIKRAVIISAGVIMNIIFAFFLIVLACLIFHKLPTGRADVFINEVVKDGFVQKNYPDTFENGDKILKVNGNNIDSTYKFIFYVQNSKTNDGKIDPEIAKENLNKLLKLNPALSENEPVKEGTTIKLPNKTPEKTLVVSDEVAKGLDKLELNEVQLSEKEINLRDKIENNTTYKTETSITLNELANAISDSYKPLDITVERGGSEIEFKNIISPKEGVLGLSLSSVDIYKDVRGIKNILKDSFNYMVSSTKYMCYGFKQLVTGKIPASEMHGIIAIAKIGSDIIQYQGMLNGLLLTALISINLAIINLLPIPALDGGHLMFIIIEKIIGRPLNEGAVENISKIFFILLIFLMVLILFNDIWALIIGKF